VVPRGPGLAAAGLALSLDASDEPGDGPLGPGGKHGSASVAMILWGRNGWENYGKTMENYGKQWKNHGKPWKNYGKVWKTMENYGKTMENYG